MRRFFTIYLLLLSSVCFSQTKTYKLIINGFPKKFSYTSNNLFADSLSTIYGLNKEIEDLKLSGFFETSITKKYWQNQNLIVELNPGKSYQGIFLENGNIDLNLINDLGLREHFQRHRSITLKSLKSLYQRIIGYYENNGYPFAAVWLDSLEEKEGGYSAKVFVNPNQKILIDTIRLVGSVKITQAFLKSYLGLKKGNLYSESKVREIDQRLRDLSFVTVSKETQVAFSGEEAKINIFLDKQNANQFDGIIGFLPNSNNGKLQLTGDFKLNLKNAIKSGESFDFNYRGLPSQSQELTAKFKYPYIFSTQIGLGFEFQLFKRDTSFLNLNTKISFDYNLSTTRKVSFFFENFKGNQVASSINQTTIPDYANISTDFYGITASYLKLDNKITPLKGMDLILEAGVGNRNINSSKDFNPDDYFEERKSTQLKLNADLKYYLKLGKQSVFYVHNLAAILSGKNLFQNEGFRIGGAKTLRGFDEQSLIASSFVIQTFEFRYLIEQNSYLNAFFDQSWIAQNFMELHKTDKPFGIGLGITFQTKAGIASLSYALGKQENNPLDLQKGKIHFGIISYF